MFYRASQAVQIHHGNILLMTNKQRKQPTSKEGEGRAERKGKGKGREGEGFATVHPKHSLFPLPMHNLRHIF